MIIISQPAFEQNVPAFRDSQPNTFEAVRLHIETYLDCARKGLGVPPAFEEQHPELVEAYIYRSAAHEAIPILDLILTDSGFAVVSNQNLAPASRERVAALRESLRQQASDARDLLLLSLCNDATWRETEQCRQLRDTLLWCAMLSRRHGLTTTDGREIYAQEHAAIYPSIQAATEACTQLISAEQMQYLLLHQDDPAESPEIKILTEHCRNYISAAAKGNKSAQHLLGTQIQRFINNNEEALTAYRNSSQYRANHAKRYENKKEDPTFFFGY